MVADALDRRRETLGLLDLDAVAWMRQAHCRAAEPGALFPVEIDRQRAVIAEWCTTCPVRTDCLEYALTHNIEHGVWGGATEKDRRMLRRARGLRRG